MSLLSLFTPLEKGQQRFSPNAHKSLTGQGINWVPSRLGSPSSELTPEWRRFGIGFPWWEQGKPMHFCRAARFARVEGEVRAEDFLEGGFFQRKVFRFGDFIQCLRLLYPLPQRFYPMSGVALKLEDFVLKLALRVRKRTLAGKILVALDVLFNKQIGETGDFAVVDGNFSPQSADRRFRVSGSVVRVFVRHFVHFLCPRARQVETSE